VPESTLTLGVVRYLNARPLFAALEARPSIRLVPDVPVRLVERFRAGGLDAAILPVFAWFSGIGDSLVRGLGIASRGATDSVRLFCRRPLREAQTVLLDPESLTSNVLCRILLHQSMGHWPTFLLPTPGAPVPEADAVLRIGDKAMRASGDEAEIVDLGELWYRWTGLPFVFAAWFVRPGLSDDTLLPILHQALDEGTARLAEIAEQGARDTGLDRAACEHYLRERIRNRLGPEEEDGIAHFAERAHREGLLRQVRSLRFYAP